MRQAIPDEAIDAVIAEAGVQERRKRLLPAHLVVSLVIGLGLWAREGLVDGLRNLVDGLRERDRGPWRAWHPPVKSARSQARRRLGPLSRCSGGWPGGWRRTGCRGRSCSACG